MGIGLRGLGVEGWKLEVGVGLRTPACKDQPFRMGADCVVEWLGLGVTGW